MRTIENKEVALMVTLEPRDLMNYLWSHYSGAANRFRRQELTKAITGITIPLVKCGVNHIAEHIRHIQHQQRIEAEKEAMEVAVEKTTEIPSEELEVGTPVIRKACKRKGIIKANVNGMLEIELEDGTIRKPAARRFKSLYKFQTA